MAGDKFGLTDAEFWSNPLKDEVEDGLPPEGLYLGAPKAVALASRDTLPLVVRRSVSLKESIAVLFKRYALVHGVDLTANRVFANWAVEQDNAVYEDRDPADLAEVRGKTLEPFLVDARRRLDLPWRASEVLFTVTIRDKVSNRCLVKLGPGANAYDDPAVAEYIEKHHKPPVPDIWPEPAAPPELAPAYVKVDGSPELPKQPGIAISGDRVTELKKGATCYLRAAFLLPVAKEDLVPPEEGERHSAVVAIHLVITGADDPTPVIRTIRAPIYGKAAAGEPSPGYFAVDLLSLFQPARRTETYFVYLFSREVMVGPQPFAFVARDRLPAGDR
jgi:hypothetical protein